MDAGSLGSIAGGVASVVAAFGVLPVIVSRQLRHCRNENADLRTRISALETELVVIKKLVPEGEWARILAKHLDDAPPPPQDWGKIPLI